MKGKVDGGIKGTLGIRKKRIGKSDPRTKKKTLLKHLFI